MFKNIGRILLVGLFFALPMSLSLGCSTDAQSPADQEIVFKTYQDDGTELSMEEAAPDFVLTSLEGQDVSLSDYPDQTVLLSFFSTT